MKKPTYYITTPIYYPSGKWHIGHCYTTVCADAMARYKRMSGFDVFYLTGTDEHGQKIEKRAMEAGQPPLAFVDGLVDEIKKLWGILDISYDKYIRTTDEYHKTAVQKIFKTLYDKGDIYRSSYKGKYCTPCEAFFTEKQLKEGKCPDCGREATDAEEDCYFFKLSKYEGVIKKLLKEQIGFLEPASRVNEMLNNFINEGLEDLAVSRTSFKWGIPVPIDSGHVIYVWIDALSNYITALGYNSDDDSLFKKFWPADLHLMAKEIVRFHAIVWPALLTALGEKLPKRIFGHGWILFDGDKMSKSKGNVVDPFILTERYGADALRYFLLREISFGSDSNYSSEMFLTRINTDLANDLGNLCKRTLAMSEQYFGGKVSRGISVESEDADIIQKTNALHATLDALLEKLNINRALEAVFALIGRANKYIDETKPWVLFKEGKTERLREVIYNLLEAVRVSANLLLPFLTQTPAKIFTALGLKTPSDFSAAKHGQVKAYSAMPIETLFPRLDIKKEFEELKKINDMQDAKKEQKVEAIEIEKKSEITIDEFFKTELKVAVIKAAEKVEKADKLLKITLDVGGEERTVVSGIAQSYSAEEIIGRQVVLVSNLKPAKLRGIESCGMLLCATSSDGKAILISPEKLVESGAEVC